MLLECLIMPRFGLRLALDLLLLVLLVSLTFSLESPNANFLARALKEDIFVDVFRVTLSGISWLSMGSASRADLCLCGMLKIVNGQSSFLKLTDIKIQGQGVPSDYIHYSHTKSGPIFSHIENTMYRDEWIVGIAHKIPRIVHGSVIRLHFALHVIQTRKPPENSFQFCGISL